MRLTNVTQMTLRDGAVSSLAIRLQARESTVPVSFDQAKHVGAGDRPGSWMAVAFTLPRSVTRDRLTEAWLAVVRRHGTLRTLFEVRGDGLQLHPADVAGHAWTDHPAVGSDVRDTVRALFDDACRPLRAPSHRLALVSHAGPDVADGPPAAGSEHTVIIGADHAHVDAWSLLVLVRDLHQAFTALERGATPFADAPAAPPFAAHTAELLSRPSAPDDVHERWRAILAAAGDVMPRFPLDLGDVSTPRDEVVEVRDVLDVDGLRGLERAAERLGVRMLVVATSVMTQVTRDLAGEPLRAILPVHSRYEQRWHDSVGWFITNAVLEATDPDPGRCAVAVRDAIALGSYPLAEIMAPHGGMPEAPGMFAISWLDHRRLPVDLPLGCDAQHVSAAIRTDGVMIWFVVNEDGLHLRCRYPDTPEARANVGRWLDAVCDGLVTAAA